MTRVLLGLGSNLGDRRGHLRDAIVSLPGVTAVSDVYETDPVGGPDQDRYLNVVVALDIFRHPGALGDLEHRAQVALVTWAAYASGAEPRLKMLFAIPNGADRGKAAAGKSKGEGQKAGVPDLCLPVPVGVYHGLYIELKVGAGRLSVEQKWWLERLATNGYAVCVPYGWENAKDAILRYLRGEWTATGVEVVR